MADKSGLNGDKSPKLNGGHPSYSTPTWNPAALLNPRSYQRTKPEAGDSFAQDGPAPHLSFEFSDSNRSFAAQNMESERTTNSREEGTGERGDGMGSMLERLHKVSDRSMLPRKRRKMQDDRMGDSKDIEANKIGRGGILGDYVREQRDNGHRENPARMVAVDLSIDDEDVMVLGDEQDKEVCYGRLEGAELNAHQVPTPKPGAQAISPGFWPQVRIVLRRRVGDKTNIIYAIDSTRKLIGAVDVNTSRGLVPILDSQYNIRTTSRILTRAKKPGDLPPGTENISCHYGLDLNLYGPKKNARPIGRFLSQKQLYLRTPMFVEAGIELFNPHTQEKPPHPTSRVQGSYGTRVQAPVRTTEEIRNDVIGMFDSLEQSEDLPEMDPEPVILTDLLKHQKQGLYFMTSKETQQSVGIQGAGHSLWKLSMGNNGEKAYYNVITGQTERIEPAQIRGGILADMMGLGKTLSILSLIVSTLGESIRWASSSSEPQDALLATRKAASTAPISDQDSAAPAILNSRATLLVSPVSTIANWEEQIRQHVRPGTLKYYIYHGSNRIKDHKKLADYDLVITTYGSVASELGLRSKKKPGAYPLEEVDWFRIILDEAHMIREQSTQQFKAICRLRSQRRWAMTGTPVQNRLEDLGALLAFLRIKPFDEKGGFAQYIMAPFKLCDPEILPKLRLLVDSITLRRLKDKIDLPQRHDHLVKLDFSSDEQMLYDIFAKNASDRVNVIVGQREKSLGGKVYVHILQSILRLRLICAHGKDLLSEDDLKVMDGLSKDSAIDLDSDEDNDRPAPSSRQAYDMYDLMKETNADLCISCNRKIGTSDGNDMDGESKDEEVIGYMTPCFHLVCVVCIDRYKAMIVQAAGDTSYLDCPICHQHVRVSYFPLCQGGVQDDEASQHGGAAKRGKGSGDYSGPHTKTKALIQDLLVSDHQTELGSSAEPPIKSVVFSGWTSHLDLIQVALQENGISYTRLDGKMSRVARNHALGMFRDDPSIRVILVSITAGGLGLNLTMANKVYVMEPQYNPAAEAQAVDRVHRLGQSREVTTVRYIMNDSFEEKMLELQEKKKKLASLSMDSRGRANLDKAEVARQRLEDLRSLFK